MCFDLNVGGGVDVVVDVIFGAGVVVGVGGGGGGSVHIVGIGVVLGLGLGAVLSSWVPGSELGSG